MKINPVKMGREEFVSPESVKQSKTAAVAWAALVVDSYFEAIGLGSDVELTDENAKKFGIAYGSIYKFLNPKKIHSSNELASLNEVRESLNLSLVDNDIVPEKLSRKEFIAFRYVVWGIWNNRPQTVLLKKRSRELWKLRNSEKVFEKKVIENYSVNFVCGEAQ